jgi:predicted HAD superfamily phosphohydrolase
MMSTAVREILNAFDGLPNEQQHEAAIEILRRVKPAGDVSDDVLVQLADELFQKMDADEANDAAS